MFYDHKRLHKRPSSLVIIRFSFTERTTNIDNKQKFNQNFRENAVDAVRPYFAPRRTSK